MPIVERDPWRMQYFEHLDCPEELFIPTEDSDSYRLYPDHRWVYNKLLIAESQGLDTAPHGLPPEHFPVFSKPIYNLRGMGIESRVLVDREQYDRYQTASHMWMPLLEGEHISSDAAVVDGEPLWWRHTTGKPLEGGMFDYWTVGAEAHTELERRAGDWLRENLRGYTGAVNLETIGGTIIECHLRFADQWPDLYGAGWLDALVELYRDGRWSYADTDRRTGYSVVLFGAHGPRYRPIAPALLAELRDQPEISSVQITFHQDRPPGRHAMPPGGFRLAVVNCWDLSAGEEARRRLALQFWSTQRLRWRRKSGH